MATGWLTWTCLLLAANTGPADDTAPMNQRSFQIPIRLQQERLGEVQELLLYMSKDQGRNWDVIAKAPPTKAGFDVNVGGDGHFWFSVAVVYRNGQREPRDIFTAPVGQKVLVDTLKPDVRITATRMGDEVQVRWEVAKPNPEWTSLKLEYRIGDSPTGQWVPLPIQPGHQGNHNFRPGIPGDVTLRLQLKDTAGNEGVATTVVPGGSGASGTLAAGPPPYRPDPGVVGVGGFEQNRGVVGVAAPYTGPSGPPQTLHTTRPDPTPPPSGPPSAPVAYGSGQEISGGASGMFPSRMPGKLPPLRIVNKRQVKLGFDVGKVGPSGLGSVEVYVTTDEGITWEKSATAPSDVGLPVSGEVRNPGPLHGSVTVQLPREGVICGFYIVVKSRAGIGKAPPASGDVPQVRIEMDATLPAAFLYEPKADTSRGEAGLILSWKATDRNLGSNPISLEWSAQRNGPWDFIGDPQLPNTGRYAWQVTDRIPPRVYLRLTVRDTAGNVAVAQTSEPVLIDVSEPVVVGDVKLEGAQ